MTELSDRIAAEGLADRRLAGALYDYYWCRRLSIGDDREQAIARVLDRERDRGVSGMREQQFGRMLEHQILALAHDVRERGALAAYTDRWYV